MGYTKELLCSNYYLVRMGDNHHKYGDAYEVSFILQHNNKSAYIKGASGKLTDMKQILKWAEDEGFEQVCWERLKDGQVKELCVKLVKNTS